ncbi:MAG: hypothetical protein FWD97_10300 [Defluviitaleaceae bacterium]|nr:hypothetical protein [Defluviitaleaceae bacterium]
MMQIKKYIHDHMPYYYKAGKGIVKNKKAWYKNPLVITLAIILGAALLAGLVVGLVKWLKKDDDILDDDWLLEDDDDVFLYPTDSDFADEEQ